MKQLLNIAQKAKHSTFYLWLLNKVLWRVIPFNQSHKVCIEELSDTHVLIRLPYQKSNQNHLKGIHACALATLCEYACGIGLMTHLDATAYRIILQDIQLKYHAQGKQDVYARFETTPDFLQQEIITPLEQFGQVSRTFTIEAYTKTQPSICTAQVTWQLKHWTKVRGKTG
jgi:acyl-coenzyme A thioesterase PaaI-like protein